jgi:hypothetical protein
MFLGDEKDSESVVVRHILDERLADIDEKGKKWEVVQNNLDERKSGRRNRDLDVVQNILNGEKYIVSHSGTGQYSQAFGRGFSSCGLAALNCAKHLLVKAHLASRPDAFVEELIAPETVEVSTLWYPVKVF